MYLWLVVACAGPGGAGEKPCYDLRVAAISMGPVGSSAKGSRHPKTRCHLLAAHKTQLLKESLVVCESGGWIPRKSPAWSKCSLQANVDTDLAMWEEGSTRDNGSCPSSLHPESTLFNFSLYVC